MSEAAAISKTTPILPLSLKDAPSFIEVQLPVNRLSAEAYKERKAGAGQTLTAFGSYWKGRKPLVLVRASVLASLLPATSNHAKDLEIFLKLMGMHDDSFRYREPAISARQIPPEWERYDELVDTEGAVRFRQDLSADERDELIAEWLSTLPYEERVAKSKRPEECEDRLHKDVWSEVNAHLGTDASSFDELVEQLGLMRFGRRPKVADTFAGGGSIPFEAARMGCDVSASDLNPVACMLTWAPLNIDASDTKVRQNIEDFMEGVSKRVLCEMEPFETDKDGNRAKAYFYCLEVRCPRTGWLVPLAPTWVISSKGKVIAKLVPDNGQKRYEIVIDVAKDEEEFRQAANGTIRDGKVVHPMNPDRDGVSIGVIRGDWKEGGLLRNRLRPWSKEDINPAPDDILQERLYAIQWVDAEDFSAGKRHARTWFASVTGEDAAKEEEVRQRVKKSLLTWQQNGLVPDMEIESGEKTNELIRTRGWTYWHHLFNPRQLLLLATMAAQLKKKPFGCLALANALNFLSRLCGMHVRTEGSGRETCIDRVFINQAFNTLYNYGCRASAYEVSNIKLPEYSIPKAVKAGVVTRPASEVHVDCDIYVTDPPYADAVNYHELTEYFIAWLRKGAPQPFDSWQWDSRRPLAIRGVDEDFRREMVAAYKAMADHMSDNGLQVVMFTHQDAGVWADLAAIMWAAGLKVTAAWNIVTETESALKRGNYVQGTILLVLRKRVGDGNVKKMDIEMEVEDEVRDQLDRMHAISDDWTGERLYTDGDYQLAAYAAALRVITSYKTIDRRDVGADVYRKLGRGERTVIRELIDYAASVANNMLVPDGCNHNLWRDLDPASRFYFRMLEMESKGGVKFADFQNFAKTFALDDYTSLMSNTTANKASLAGAIDLKGRMLGDEGFGSSPLRLALFAVWKTHQKDGDPKEGVTYLRTELGPDFWATKAKLIEIAEYLRDKNRAIRPDESEAAGLLVEALKMDRL